MQCNIIRIECSHKPVYRPATFSKYVEMCLRVPLKEKHKSLCKDHIYCST